MRTDARASTIRLADYRPPAFLAESVELTFALDPAATRVRARVSFRRNPAREGEPALDLRLDGRGLRLVSAAIDGAPVAQNALAVDDEGLTVAADHVPQQSFVWEAETEIAPAANTALEGLYMSRGMYCTQCEAQGFRKITYWPDRPDVMATFRVRIEGDAAGAAVERQPRRLRPGLGGVGGPVSEALLPLRARRRRPRRRRGPLRDPLRPRRAAADLGPRRRRGPLRLRDGRAQARDGLGRGGLRPRVRPRPLHDRRRRRLQHGGDGEQGAQRLQLALRAGEPRDRDRRRLQGDRGDHRARVLPQLDRQPDHLPRLVPALPEGGADGLPRPAVLGRPALGGGRSGSRT